MAVPTKGPNCKFCLQNEFAIVAKNDQAVSIICDTAKNWGHSLIIPKNHSSNLFSAGMDETIWKEGMVPMLRETIKKLSKNPQVIGFHINSNGGSMAEQTVFHTHIHVVPKYMKDKDEWISFFNNRNYGEGSKMISGRWDDIYPEMMNYINDCLKPEKGILKKNGSGVVESFNLVSLIGERGGTDAQEGFAIIPKPSNYHWQGGANCKCYNFEERKKIAERINNEKWEEESAKKPSIPKNGEPAKEPTKNNDNQQPNQNGNSDTPKEDQNNLPVNNKNFPVPNQGNHNQPSQNSDDQNTGQKDNIDEKKNKKSPEIPNSVKKYFQKNGLKSLRLDGENWIFTYNNNNKKEYALTNVPELHELANYMKFKKKNTFDASELETSSKNTTAGKNNETKYWLWILGGIILAITLSISWLVIRNKRKQKWRKKT